MTPVQQELYNALLNTCNISEEASELLKNWIMGGSSSGGSLDYDLMFIAEYSEESLQTLDPFKITTIKNNFNKILNCCKTLLPNVNNPGDEITCMCLFIKHNTNASNDYIWKNTFRFYQAYDNNFCFFDIGVAPDIYWGGTAVPFYLTLNGVETIK